MTFNRLAYIILISIATTSAAWAQNNEVSWNPTFGAASTTQSYTLGWSTVDKDVDRAAPPAPVSRQVAPQPEITFSPPAPQARRARRAAPQAYAPSGRRINRRPQIPVYNVEFNTSQFYDVYAERYLKVRAVEVQAYRRGYQSCDIFENSGECAQYDVYLRDLRPGDRYRVTVIWENGSNRTVEATMDNYADSSVFIDQPDAMAYSAW